MYVSEAHYNLLKYYHLDRLVAGLWSNLYDDQDKIIDGFNIISYWVANIYVDPINDTQIILSVIRTSKKYICGLFMLPSQRPDEFQYAIVHIDLETKFDLVSESLHQVDIFPEVFSILSTPLPAIPNFHFEIQFGTTASHGEFYFAHNWLQKENYDRVWQSLVKTMQYVNELHHNKPLRTYIFNKLIKTQYP